MKEAVVDRMKKRSSLVTGAAALLALVALALPAPAAPLDGSVPLLCVSSRAFDCSGGDGCVETSAEGVEMADLLLLDVKEKKLTALDEDERGEASAIAAVSHANGRLVVSGVDGGRGWTLAVQEDGGDSVLTVSDTGIAVIVYGECTAK
jgi:hypothetical protein